MAGDAHAESLTQARGAFDVRRFSGNAALVIGAAIIANLCSFVFHFTLSRRLGPEAYGTLVTLMAIAGMLSVLGQSVGTVAMQETARLWTSHLDAAIGGFVRQAGGLVASAAVVVILVLVAASVPLRSYLHVTEPLLWWLLGVYVAMTLFAGFARGAAQGAHRFWIFAASLVCEGIAKVAIAFAAVAAGYGVAGALGGLIAGALIAIALVFVPLVISAQSSPQSLRDSVRLGGESLKVLAVTAATSALLFIDMLFAKHHFSGELAGDFGAAGTVARTLPFAVGLIGLIVMPNAAAARHAGREALANVLGSAAMLSALAVLLGAAAIIAFPAQIESITYGPRFAAAASLLRIYAIDTGLLGLWGIAISYLVAVASYDVFWFLLGAVIVEGTAMAVFGVTPLRLLSIGIITNALLLPCVWVLALRTVRLQPQAGSPPHAEAAT
jgi:O-antigen/teichoic acid export membrane protein